MNTAASCAEEREREKAKSHFSRWSELTRKLEFKVEVQELNEAGEYSGVEVSSHTHTHTHTHTDTFVPNDNLRLGRIILFICRSVVTFIHN